MFTGIITAVGHIKSAQAKGDGLHLVVEVPSGYLDDVALGDSIAIQGACMTATELTDTTFQVIITMDRPEIGKEISKLYEINSIYYDLDKADIRADAAEELDKIVQFLTDNPQMNLELGAHTDARASTGYNLKLSQHLQVKHH